MGNNVLIIFLKKNTLHVDEAGLPLPYLVVHPALVLAKRRGGGGDAKHGSHQAILVLKKQPTLFPKKATQNSKNLTSISVSISSSRVSFPFLTHCTEDPEAGFDLARQIRVRESPPSESPPPPPPEDCSTVQDGATGKGKRELRPYQLWNEFQL